MQFLLFGALQHGSTLHEFSLLLTRRAAITLDDSPNAWGDVEGALLMHVVPAKVIADFDNAQREVSFDMYMDALACHGAEVEGEPQAESDSDGGGLSTQYKLVPTGPPLPCKSVV